MDWEDGRVEIMYIALREEREGAVRSVAIFLVCWVLLTFVLSQLHTLSLKFLWTSILYGSPVHNLDSVACMSAAGTTGPPAF